MLLFYFKAVSPAEAIYGTDTAPAFRLTKVSPGRSWDERNNYSTRLKPVICSLLMTLAKSSKNAVLALGNLRSIR